MIPARVAIITRTRNRPAMLRRAIDSVLNQSFEDWMHYIVNDGGEPQIIDDIIKEYAARYKGRVEVIHNPTSFTMEAASNTGIIRGSEEFITIHDDDDSWNPTFLERTVERLSQLSEDPTYGGVVTQARVIVERELDGGFIEISNHIFEDYGHVSYMDMLWRNRFPPICLLFRRVAMEQVGLFDTSLVVLGDWDFHLRLYRKFKVEVIPEALAHYHHRPDGVGEASNSVYKDAGAHRRNLSDYIDNAIRSELDKGDLAYGELLLHARTMNMLDTVETALHRKLDQVKGDIVWELKQYIDWRLKENQ
ncbi:MAG: hypothetical protein JWR80_8026 [Bradyrhizobium sp.]|nr:hypothetical protein [Bradyrhizobium sp.]